MLTHEYVAPRACASGMLGVVFMFSAHITQYKVMWVHTNTRTHTLFFVHPSFLPSTNHYTFLWWSYLYRVILLYYIHWYIYECTHSMNQISWAPNVLLILAALSCLPVENTPHINADTNICACARTHPQTHEHPNHTHTNPDTNTQTHKLTCMHRHKYTQTPTHMRAHSQTQPHTNTHTKIHTHRNTQSQCVGLCV